MTTAEAEAVIRAHEDERLAAMLASDADRLAQLLADDLVYMHTTGDHDTKDSYVEKVRVGFVTYKHLERENEQIIVHGDVAYITGHQIGLSVLQGRPRLIDSYYLAIWKRVDGAWRFCAWQATSPAKSTVA